ncbi:YdiU family protein [Flavobacterium sp. SUN046]|uniref:protein adenylyltransferase SelO n=1 Tax=Flavobacterium sp. SUN046 TaxID=3002440 RepID=UPI002DBE5028|nr:YdiU family protein [Flavobacterium sp. SUN046]MEC4048593.1 YdiU family protein [Flavobacterium sp. SUN046]
MPLHIENRFSVQLPADTDESNTTRQVHQACFSYVTPRIPSNPSWIHYSKDVAALIGITEEELQSDEYLNYLSGKILIQDTKPYAMAYAGHQFGNWAGQLGDGRAINLTEVVYENNYYTLQLKGAGSTPYSRRADGLAVLRSSIREHLCSEAMHYLGIPTTRSLSLILTGDEVLRDMLYDGHPALEKGAVVCRVAPSFIRFGSFELFASRNDVTNLKRLTDFTIKHHFPQIIGLGKQQYIEFFQTIASTTLEMIIHWQRVGFVHGVMNTDNMSIHGITIDYGPYGWLDDFNLNWTPNTTDREHGRYRYGNQPEIALWNLYQLANALYPLIDEAAPLEAVLNQYKADYDKQYNAMMQSKLGLLSAEDTDALLMEELVQTLQFEEIDMTLFFRNLSKINKTTTIDEALALIENAFYNSPRLLENTNQLWADWMASYLNRLQKETASNDNRTALMNSVNPKYVLRNYMAQLAIDAADKGDYSVLNELYELLQHPYDEQTNNEKWFAKRPDWARNKVGCSMLSCSS